MVNRIFKLHIFHLFQVTFAKSTLAFFEFSSTFVVISSDFEFVGVWRVRFSLSFRNSSFRSPTIVSGMICFDVQFLFVLSPFLVSG